jgi:two-component system OmpR family sensor kinase
MSSSQPPESPSTGGAARPGDRAGARSRRPFTLRTKLIAGIVGIIVVVCAVVGVVTEIALSQFLMAQKDSQLTAAQGRVFPNGEFNHGPYNAGGGASPGGGVTPTRTTAGAEPATGSSENGSGTGTSATSPTSVTRGTYGGAYVTGSSPTCTVPAAGGGASPTTGSAGSGTGGAGGTGQGGTGQGGTGQGGPLPPTFLFRGVQALGTLGAVIRSGSVVNAGILTGETTCTAVGASATAVLLSVPVGHSPTTVTIPGQGDFRVIADQLPSGDVAVIGLPLQDLHDTLVRLAVIMVAVSTAGLIAGGLIVFFLVRRSLRPLERVAATARKVSTLPLARGDVDLGIRVPATDTDPRTEVGQVGSALNQMLGHVSSALEARHASEQRVRRFVADASHELRTPLAAIRGYAELARRGEPDPSTVSHALGRVESESARMTTLVDDLLLLARLDSGRPLDSQEVDLTMLAVDAVSDARAAGPDHRWRLDLPDEPVTVTGDQSRLYQVLVNLLANARSHTPPGTTVVTGLRPPGDDTGDQVVLSVHDDGPGIPSERQSEVFERFYRGDSSRSRAMGSTGLGLAIVSAVVSAHGGRVELQSRPGSTTFRVVLPTTWSGPAPADDPSPQHDLSRSLG